MLPLFAFFKTNSSQLQTIWLMVQQRCNSCSVCFAEKQRTLIVKVKNEQLGGFTDNKIATISCKLVCLPS